MRHARVRTSVSAAFAMASLASPPVVATPLGEPPLSATAPPAGAAAPSSATPLTSLPLPAAPPATASSTGSGPQPTAPKLRRGISQALLLTVRFRRGFWDEVNRELRAAAEKFPFLP